MRSMMRAHGWTSELNILPYPSVESNGDYYVNQTNTEKPQKAKEGTSGCALLKLLRN